MVKRKIHNPHMLKYVILFFFVPAFCLLSSCVYQQQQQLPPSKAKIHIYETAEQLMTQLPVYDDDTPVLWREDTPAPWNKVNNIGQLKAVLTPELLGEHSVKNKTHPLLWLYNAGSEISWIDNMYDFHARSEKMRSSYAARDIILEYGSSPQWFNQENDETIFLIHIKHGLNAQKPVRFLYPGGGSILEYPLVWKFAHITPPVMEWFLRNGASPNQRSRDGKLTPYKNLHFRFSLDISIAVYEQFWNRSLNYYRTPEGTRRMEDLLRQYGAKDVPRKTN